MNLKIATFIFFMFSLVYADKPIFYPMQVHNNYPIDVEIYYPMGQDSDNDSVVNENDPFPNNPNEWLDTDHDGIGNNADTDDDGDGISDEVEKSNGLNPLNPADAQADYDNDGFSNVIELNAGTDIRSAKSKPTWTPIIMGEIMIFIPAKP